MLVSIVIPVFNVSAYIERCLESVVKQTYNNIECIIVDDASDDDSLVKCERLIAGYRGDVRFSIIHNDNNRGLSATRNVGVEIAKGEYLFFLDGDDVLMPDCIEKLVRPVKTDSTIDVVSGLYRHFSDVLPTPPIKQKIHAEIDIPSQKEVREFYFGGRGYPMVAWNKLVNKTFWYQNNLWFKEGILYEDSVWTFNVMKCLQHLYIIPDVTYLHFIRPDSICYGTNKEIELYYRSLVFEDIANHFTKGEETREARYYLLLFCSYFVQDPKNERFQRTALLFKKALSDGRHSKEILLLSTIFVLSKVKAGRMLLLCCWEVRAFLKGRRKKGSSKRR